jgi:hypothetical protein
LAMLTTALNLGRPFRFPFESRDLYFVKEEFDALLPPAIATWMAAKARASETATKLSRPGKTLLALPLAEDMPVLLGIRLSLSFPLLLSAIPLYSIDRTRKENTPTPTVASRILFSDGGICSNFPVHFFDGALPSRPTFGVNLRSFHPDHPQQRVWMPPMMKNDRGAHHFIPDISNKPGCKSVFAFLSSIMATMQNWRDQVQVAMPGYRDRIVHVCHSDKEGGMNLNMPAPVITDLGRSGADAASKLRETFLPGADATGGGWYNHRRIRIRTLLAGIDQKLRALSGALHKTAVPTWADLLADDRTDAYPFKTSAHRKLALEVLNDLAALGVKVESSGIDLATGAPRPEAEWRATPRV